MDNMDNPNDDMVSNRQKPTIKRGTNVCDSVFVFALSGG